MNRYIIAGMVLMSSQISLAEPFAFQKAIGSSELDPSIWEGPSEIVKRGAPSDFKDSLTAVYELADLDGGNPFAHKGTIEPSGPTRVSLYESYRDTHLGEPYGDYYTQFPSATDGSAVAQTDDAHNGNI